MDEWTNFPNLETTETLHTWRENKSRCICKIYHIMSQALVCDELRSFLTGRVRNTYMRYGVVANSHLPFNGKAGIRTSRVFSVTHTRYVRNDAWRRRRWISLVSPVSLAVWLASSFTSVHSQEEWKHTHAHTRRCTAIVLPACQPLALCHPPCSGVTASEKSGWSLGESLEWSLSRADSVLLRAAGRWMSGGHRAVARRRHDWWVLTQRQGSACTVWRKHRVEKIKEWRGGGWEKGRRFCTTKQMLESGLRGRVESISEGSDHWRGGRRRVVICFARLRLIVLSLKGVRSTGDRLSQSSSSHLSSSDSSISIWPS